MAKNIGVYRGNINFQDGTGLNLRTVYTVPSGRTAKVVIRKIYNQQSTVRLNFGKLADIQIQQATRYETLDFGPSSFFPSEVIPPALTAATNSVPINAQSDYMYYAPAINYYKHTFYLSAGEVILIQNISNASIFDYSFMIIEEF